MKSNVELLAPSWGTGADGDFEPRIETCGICLFPLTACICDHDESTAESTSAASAVRPNP